MTVKSLTFHPFAILIKHSRIFKQKKVSIILHHLHISTDGSYLDAIYLYSTTMFCKNDKDIGKIYIDKVGWSLGGMAISSDQC
ncbi:hypothetical protein IGI04_002836 [Brassica rapa subsp. trilocularis]|uniref:Uncharacterized protein n=1 Tax=Brassica rapa subsp. trilocularis TaxID=1813537 RepID=A0ABQ7NWQ2_BRACM|nr:hypothetical protein IGI04_002836 [Brassica rapa subsp. trilocularis]